MRNPSTAHLSLVYRPRNASVSRPGHQSLPSRWRASRAVDGPAFALRSDLDGLTAYEARAALQGLPAPGDYLVVVKPLRYRTQPSLSALCEFDLHRIVLRVPQPFRPFDEIVYYAARRKPGPGWAFEWVSEIVNFQEPKEVLRFLYCHEWMHWYLREILGKRSGAETACDRFALRNFRRERVGVPDADAALAIRRGAVAWAPTAAIAA